MFDTLGERLNKALDGVRGSGNLTEDQVKKVTREIRLALLEADVNYAVVHVNLEQGQPDLTRNLLNLLLGEVAATAYPVQSFVEPFA